MDQRRRVPRTDAVLADPRLVAAAARAGRHVVKSAVTRAQERARGGEIEPERVADAALEELRRVAPARAVINATGVLLHTNLGRAPLSAAAVDAVATAAGNTDVEFDLDSGGRARRGRGRWRRWRRRCPRPAGCTWSTTTRRRWCWRPRRWRRAGRS
ncbi:hypothetical protein [Thermocatellispora tengchongensis]|uniref:hypothetical protein n=1 Tax=Thermocatellispora tengchongensis TaxID=1073253 RepID=UPI003628085E